MAVIMDWDKLSLFVRKMNVGTTIVLLADIDDNVLSLHEQIEAITGIPILEQRLIYMGRQLEHNQSLRECSIRDYDYELQLSIVGGMRSSVVHPKAWHMVDDMVSLALRLCSGVHVLTALGNFMESITDFLQLSRRTTLGRGFKQLRILSHLSAPAALVRLYRSPIRANKDCAFDLIKYFIELLLHPFSNAVEMWTPIIVLEFCNLLRRHNGEEEEEEEEDSLYVSCRTFLGCKLITAGMTKCVSRNKRGPMIKTTQLFPFLNELTNKLSIDLSSSIQSTGPSKVDVRDFTAFSGHLRRTISEQLSFHGSKHVQVCGVGGGEGEGEGFSNNPYYGEEGEVLYNVYRSLMGKMEECLEGMEGLMGNKGTVYLGWSRYLVILKELSRISRLFEGVEQQFWTAIRSRKSCICELRVRFGLEADDYECDWIFCRKDALSSEFRTHYLSMLSVR